MTRQEFEAALDADDRGHVRVWLPFDPVEVWGARIKHFASGTFNGVTFQTSLAKRGGGWFFPVNATLRKQAGAESGSVATVVLEPAEPAALELPDDLAAALQSEPKAAAFFADMSGFYQRQYASWVTGAKSATTRSDRVRTVVELLVQGRKQR